MRLQPAQLLQSWRQSLRNEIIQEAPARWELLQRDAREGHQPGWRHFRRWASPAGPRVLAISREMDRGVSLENPYASVNIPREQFQQSFITRYLKDEPTVIANPAAVPTYSVEEQAGSADSRNSPTIATGKSWSRPYNPYASLRMPNGESSSSFYTVTLDKPLKGQEQEAGGVCGCCKCCPCRKCCCVIS
nr:cysteine-rich tail protein 1 [Columba livia]